jgi:hypothetical protein
LLNQQHVEKRLVLIGDFSNAHKIRRMNKRAESVEAVVKHEEYQTTFTLARNHLLERHARECEDLHQRADLELREFQRLKARKIEKWANRVRTLQGMVAEDGQLPNFVARKFKKGPEFVLPMTVTLDGGDDIPPAGKTRFFLTGTMHSFREAKTFGPLPLPALKVRHVRNPPRAYVPPPPKEDDV